MYARVTEASDKGKRKSVSHASQQKLKNSQLRKDYNVMLQAREGWKIHLNPPVSLVISTIGIICTDVQAEAFQTASTNAEGKHCI